MCRHPGIIYNTIESGNDENMQTSPETHSHVCIGLGGGKHSGLTGGCLWACRMGGRRLASDCGKPSVHPTDLQLRLTPHWRHSPEALIRFAAELSIVLIKARQRSVMRTVVVD